MNGLLAIIALLFGFAAVAGPAAAAASAGVSPTGPVLVIEGQFDVCAEPQPLVPKVMFKLCSKVFKTGINVFCHQCLAVMPGAGVEVTDPGAVRTAFCADDKVARRYSSQRQFRPPRHLSNG